MLELQALRYQPATAAEAVLKRLESDRSTREPALWGWRPAAASVRTTLRTVSAAWAHAQWRHDPLAGSSRERPPSAAALRSWFFSFPERHFLG